MEWIGLGEGWDPNKLSKKFIYPRKSYLITIILLHKTTLSETKEESKI